MDERTTNRLSACERRNQWFGRLLVLHSVIVSLALALFAASCTSASLRSADVTTLPSLRVSELVVVDPNGVERVRIGGDLPDAVIEGRRIPRGDRIAGFCCTTGRAWSEADT